MNVIGERVSYTYYCGNGYKYEYTGIITRRMGDLTAVEWDDETVKKYHTCKNVICDTDSLLLIFN